MMLFAGTSSAGMCTPAWTRNSGAPGLAVRGFGRVAPAAHAADEAPRDVVVLCHVMNEAVARGGFNLDNLPNGRVDVLARCASSAIFLSHGVRSNTRLWLQLQNFGMALCLDGGAVRGEQKPPHDRRQRSHRSHAPCSQACTPTSGRWPPQ